MTYDEIKVGDRVKAMVTKSWTGTVKAKEIVDIAGRGTERVYIDSDNHGRRLAHPSVLVKL